MYTLVQLEQAIRQSWGPDTVDPDDGWSAENPARGHCDVTALVVHDFVGGALMASDVFLDGDRIMAHMWNRLPSGIEVDLTREQSRTGKCSANRRRAGGLLLRSWRIRRIPGITAITRTSCWPNVFGRGSV